MNIGTKCLQAQAQGRDDFWFEGRLWDVATLKQIKALPSAVPSHVVASIVGKPQAKAKPVGHNPYKALAKATPSEFRKEVEELMQVSGCTRLEATRLLSKAAGLTEQKQSGNYFQRTKQAYRS